MGHVVLAAGIVVDPTKVEIVSRWKSPIIARVIQSFMGFGGYYRRFIQGFSSLAVPLYG